METERWRHGDMETRNWDKRQETHRPDTGYGNQWDGQCAVDNNTQRVIGAYPGIGSDSGRQLSGRLVGRPTTPNHCFSLHLNSGARPRRELYTCPIDFTALPNDCQDLYTCPIDCATSWVTAKGLNCILKHRLRVKQYELPVQFSRQCHRWT